jgi:monooxygenase
VNFSSGYIQRALAKQPKQGSKRPWKLYQNYGLDLLSLRFGSVRDRAMVFSGQVNDRVAVPNAPKAAT